MTFTEIVAEVMDRLNLTSSAATTRVGRAVNRIYREVGTSIGMSFSRSTAVSEVVTVTNPEVTFSGTEKILQVWTITGTKPNILDEVMLAELREVAAPSSDTPHKWAVRVTGSNFVTIRLDAVPATAYTLYAEVIAEVTTLSGSDEPAFAESFHDLIVDGVLKDEYKKLEKRQLAADSEATYQRRLSDLRMFMAKSNSMLIRQGEHSSRFPQRAGTGGGSVSLGVTPLTITGAWTFDRDPSAPFLVTSGSAVVTNLDADMLDGQHGSYYTDAANINTIHDGSGAATRTVRAKLRQIERSIMDYGADPSNSAADNYTAITEALTATPRGSTLWIDKGTFNTNGPLVRNQVAASLDEASIHLRGHGKDSILRCMNNQNLLQFTADEGTNVVGFSLRDFLLTYDAGLTAGSALYLRHWHYGQIENVYVNGAPVAALRMAQCITNSVINFHTVNGFDIGGAIAPRPQYGILIEDYLGVASNLNTFIGGGSNLNTASTGYGIYLGGTGRGNRFYGMAIQSNDVGIYVEANHVDWTFDGCWLEANTTDYTFNNGQGTLRTTGDAARRAVCTYRARGVSNANQSIADGTPTDVTFQTNTYNVGYSGNIHETVGTPTRFVAPIAGVYHLETNLAFASSAVGYRIVQFVKNGLTATSPGLQVVPVTAAATIVSLSDDVLLAKDDYITVQVTQNSGGNLNVSSGATASIRWVAEEFTT
jgi:hypothetical protein